MSTSLVCYSQYYAILRDIQRTSFPCFSLPLSVHVLFLSDVWSFRSCFHMHVHIVHIIHIYIYICNFMFCCYWPVCVYDADDCQVSWLNCMECTFSRAGYGRSPLHCSPSARSCWIPDVMNWGQTPSPFSDPKWASSNSHWHETQRIAAEMAIDYLQAVDVPFRSLMKYRKMSSLLCGEKCSRPY